MTLHRVVRIATLVSLASAMSLVAQRPAPGVAAKKVAASARSAPITNIHYEVTFDSATAKTRSVKVSMTFDVSASRDPVLLSLPAWTPGAYEISNFARWVSNFSASAGSRALGWDKLDPDTWRIRGAGPGPVAVKFDYLADSLDNAMAWARPDFLLFNGTNVFLYAEGRGFDFSATVAVKTQSDWRIATSMKSNGAPSSYGQTNYHDLVDMPFFVGRFDYDSTVVAGKTTRLASYPAGIMAGAARSQFWEQIAKAIPVEAAVFQQTPWESYTVMTIFDSSYGGGSALEHQSSHVGIYSPQMIGNPLLASITAHEIFHAWNVKRLRPADMVPYRYDSEMPTPWLWVSEGITDYYADLALVRGQIVDSTVFLGLTAEKTQMVAGAPPTALQDASLSTWIHPTDGSGYLYYAKGSLAGLLLDIIIRDASDNRHSLDDVMRELYQTTYMKGRGFTGTDWWGAVSRAAGGKSFTDFDAKYIDGRDPFPYETVFALAGLRVTADTVREPRLGVSAAPDSGGARITGLQPGSVAAEAGVKVGDVLIGLGDLSITDPEFGTSYRAKFRNAEGEDLPIKVRRGTETLTLTGKVRLVEQVNAKIEPDPNAGPKPVKIRSAIFGGTKQ